MQGHLVRPGRCLPLILMAAVLLLTSLTLSFAYDGKTLAKYNSNLDAKLMAEARPFDTPLMPAFIAASKEYRVPLPLLLTLAYLGSGFENRGGAPTIEGGYGVMALRDNILGGESLALGSTLTVASIDTLRFDPEANIRAAAAVLANYGGSLRQRGTQGLDGWLPAVVKYAGLDPDSSKFFAYEVFSKLKEGLMVANSAGEAFVFDTQSIGKLDLDSLKPKSAQQVSIQSADYGPAIWDPAASCNYTATVTAKDTIVVHTIEGTAAGAISWFKNCNAQVSAHYVIAENGTVWQCVSEAYRAWHCGCYNSRSIGFEHEGYAGSSSHPTSLYNASAALAREICNERGIPKAHTGAGPGIMGHNDVNVICGGTHWDPGGGWDWGYYISQINNTPRSPTPAVGVNADGRMEVFARGWDNQMYHTWQTTSGGTWTAWYSLGGSLNNNPCVRAGSNGALQMFSLSTLNALWSMWQTAPNGGWSAWNPFYGSCAGDPCLGISQNGCLQVFVRGSDNQIWTKWQTSPGGTWTADYQSLGGNVPGNPKVVSAQNQCMQLFVRGGEGNIWAKWQTVVNGSFSAWQSFGGNMASDPAIVMATSGCLQLFVRGADNQIYTTWQTAPNGVWASWVSFGGNVRGNPSAARSQNGCLQMFVRGGEGAIWTKWQLAPGGSWTDWSSLGGNVTGDPVVITAPNGCMQLFVSSSDGLIWTKWQTAPNGVFSGWNVLGDATPRF